ncbi:hypothetical protein HPB50_025092 [Hyalomma asiaticum]|uniref:Uncharacterized protein n=1 Tax=Hyalomma asiaticum TaxID=266040 RepID=A0ACB7SQ77_HYAAI|nr:hypothetical protein HPB50_025092 [Hyalomma asiaticum]
MAQGSSGKADKARNLQMSVEGMEDLMSPEDNELIKGPKNKRKRGRKKDKRDKRRERREKKKKQNAEDAEGLEDAREFSNREDDFETDVAWSPASAPSSTEERKQELRFEMFFDMMNEELGGLRDNIEAHERQLLDFAAPLVCRIPQPPKPYITRLCCCTKCCGRCCDIYGHQQKVLHPPLTSDVGTDSMETDVLEDSKKRMRKKRLFTPDMDFDTTGVGYGEDFASSISRKGSQFKNDSAEKDSDSDTSDDSARRGSRSLRRRLTATKVIRRKSHEMRRTPSKNGSGSASGASTPASDLMRKARLSRKGFTKKKLFGGLQRKSHEKQSPPSSLQNSTDMALFGGPASLEDMDDTLGALDSTGASPAGWRSPPNEYDLLAAKARSASHYPDKWPTAGHSELMYYTEQPASPLSGEVLIRAVQSSPIDVYSMRMTPDAPSSYARQGQFEWPPFRPPAAQPYQDRRLPPLTAAAFDLSGKANIMARQARDTFDAAKVLKKASDDALEIAMKNQYFDSRAYDQVSLGSMERESQESLSLANQSAYPPAVRMEVPQQQPFPQPPIAESRPVAKSILKTTGSSYRSLPSRNVGSERSLESSFVEDDRFKPPPSLTLGSKVKIKPAEAEASGEAKSEGRPRARFANLPSETTPRKTGIRRRGSVFVSGNLLPDEDDEEEKKIAPVNAVADEFVAKKASDAEPPSSVDALQRLKLSISSLSNVQSKKQEMDNEALKRQDLTSHVSRDAGGAHVTVKKMGSFLVTDTRDAKNVSDGKRKLEGATITDIWRKQDVVTVCDRSTWISMDRATETPDQWENPQMRTLQGLDPCRLISTLSFLSSCSKCASEESEESDTFLTPRSMRSFASASQTSLFGSVRGRKHSDDVPMSENDGKPPSSRRRRPSKSRPENRKRRHSMDRRRHSSSTEKEQDDSPERNAIRAVDDHDVLRNGDDFHKDTIVTTKLSDTLLDVANVGSPISTDTRQSGVKRRRISEPREEESVASGRRASVHENHNGNSKHAPASSRTKESRGSENTSTAPTATKHRREINVTAELQPEPEVISRRASADAKPRKSSVKADEEQQYVVLPVEPLPPQESGEATPVLRENFDRQEAANKNPGADVPTTDENQIIGEQPQPEHESRRASGTRKEPVHSTSRKTSVQSRQATAADVREVPYNGSLPARLDDDEAALEEGVPEYYDVQNDFGNIVPEDEIADERHVNAAEVEHRERTETVPAQDVKPTLLQIPEPEAQLAAVVTIPFEGDRKFWFYKDSTVSLYPESTFGVTAAFVCAGWIMLLMFLTEMHHGWFAVHAPTTSSLGPTLSRTVETRPYPIPEHPPPEIPETSEPPDITVTGSSPYTNIATDITAVPSMDTYYCATVHCDKEARYLSAFVLGDPCENFYEDVCVNRTRMWPQPAPGASTSTNSMMAEQIQAIALWYINDDRNNDVRIARNLLSVCVHESEKERLSALKSMVNEVLGVSWPIDQAYETSLPNPWEAAGKLASELALEPLATLSIDVHPEKAGVMIIGIDEPALFQRRSSTGAQLSNLINNSVREAVRIVTEGPEVEEISNLIMETMFTICDLFSAPSVRYFGSENYRLTLLGDLPSGVRSMLDAIFFRHKILDDGSEVLVKSPFYFERLLDRNVAPRPRGLLNYMGYRVVLLFAAFTSSSALQEVHSILAHRPLDLRDGTRLDLCAREVEHVLPAMYTRALFRQMRNTSFDGLARVWSSKVEQVFQRGLSRLSWFRKRGYGFHDSVDLRLANHKLSTSRMRYFYPSWVMNNASYAAYAYQLQVQLDQVRGYSDSGVKFMRILYGLRFAEKIEPFLGRASGLSFPASSLDASPKYDVQTKSLFVPAAVMNASVPTNGSMFAFHIARYGVRLIKGLMPVLYNDFVFSSGPYDDAPLLYTQAYDRRLRDTVKCLVADYNRAPDLLKSSFMRSMGDISPAGFSLLEQTVALMAAYWAFQELLTVKRVWRSDFRFAQLPDLSSDQLFFVYYALDNCERSDEAYQARAFDARFELPPEERVNFPLLQSDAFKHAFGCRGRSPMATPSQCSVAS